MEHERGEARRPDPDALLARLTADEARTQRARLRVFFGAAPGVGKTFAMLEQARRARAEGADVVIGIVETHGRAETAALTGGIPALARRSVVYRGVVLDELDLEAALARRPGVLLVDELAHTNAPGSRHVKRWQDVRELLDAGIEVWTTLNVQHLESLRDVVEQITGVVVRETVPDAILERADEVALIDLAPEALLERLADGKVYLADQASRAANGFFERGNLLALRELALRTTAERVDADVIEYRRAHGIAETWAARERVLVCTGPAPASERLIRAARRIAEGVHAPWIAAHVDVIGAPPLAAADRERVEAHLRLAETLGGEVARLHGRSIAGALLDYARGHDVTRIVAGKPTHGRWRDRLRGSLLDALIRGSSGIEIHVIAPAGEPSGQPVRGDRDAEEAPERPGTAGYASAVAGVALVTAIGLVAFDYVTSADLTMLYLIAIMLASLLGRGPALVAASLAVAAFDFMFVAPRFTFAVSDGRQLLTFAVMFGAGLAISTLTTRLRRQEHDAVARERRTQALLAFTREIAGATSDAGARGAADVEVAAITARHTEDALDVAACVLVPDAQGDGLVAAAGLMPLAPQELSVARWSFEHRAPAGHGTDTLPGARILCVPLSDGGSALGVIALQRRPGTPPRLDVDQRHMLDAIARQSALALRRIQLAREAREAALRIRAEELRSSLLSAVSHDLRTPLSVITGAATTLRDAGDQLPPGERGELISSIVEDAQRLERVLANLLQLTRVEAGIEAGLAPRREWVSAEELVGAALTRLEDALGSWTVETDVPADVMLHIDPLLFEQLLINLVENAIKHGAPPLAIRARQHAGAVELEVIDHGAGLPVDAERLFDRFVRASSAPGAGLGLAVVRAIVQLHGGTVGAENVAGGGARFHIALPAPADQPPVDRAVEERPS